MYPKAEIDKIALYWKKLKDIAPRRNEAAHGGNYLLYTDVCTDKSNVFNSEVSAYRGLILELFDILLLKGSV